MANVAKYCLPAAQGLLLLAIFALPWCFPGRQMPSRLIAMSVAVVALLLLGSNVVVAGAAWRAIRVPLILLACAVGLGAWQLTTPAAMLSPMAADWKSDFAATPEAAAPATALSFYEPGTRRHLALLVCAIAAVALGAALFAETKPMMLLLSVVAVTAFVVACSGLIERAAGRFYPFLPLPLPMTAAPFGPFLNRNAAGALLELGLAAATGLIAWRMARIPRRSIDNHRIDHVQWFLMHVDTPMLVSFGALVTIAAAAFISLSRGTMLSALVGALAAFVIAGNRTNRRSYFWLAATTAMAAAVLGIWLVQTSVLEQRWSSILAGDILGESRWQLWEESFDAARILQPFGSGLGTFYYAHAPFERHTTLSLYRNAENQYVEAVVVAGVCGLALLVALCVLIVRAVSRMWRKAQSPEHIGLAAGSTALVAMQLVHACFDFAWYVSPVMIPLAVWAGAIFRKATIKRAGPLPKGLSTWWPNAESVPPEDRGVATVWGYTVPVLLLLGLGWSIWETGRSMIVERAEWDTRNHGELERTTEVIDEAIKRQTAAVDVYPDDGEARLRLAELWVERYGSEFRVEMDRDPIMRLSPEKFRVWQNPAVLNAAANLRGRVGDDAGIAQLRELPIVKENLLPALAEVRLARALCPLSPFAQTLTAELCFLDEAPSNDEFYLKRAEKLSGGRPDWLFTIGQLHLNGARPERAWMAWKEAWSMSSANEDSMMQQASAYLKPQEILEKLIPSDPQKIVALADRYYPEPDGLVARRAYFDKAKQLLDAANRHRAADEYVRGTAQVYAGKFDEAEASFIGAIRAIEAKPEWYLELAVIQAALGHRKEAASTADRYRSIVRGGDPEKTYLRRSADLLRRTPNIDDQARRRCALLYLEVGVSAEAAEMARESLAKDPADIDSQITLARALLQGGDAQGALDVAKKAEEAAPEREDIHNLRETINAAIKNPPPTP